MDAAGVFDTSITSSPVDGAVSIVAFASRDLSGVDENAVVLDVNSLLFFSSWSCSSLTFGLIYRKN